MAGLAIKPNGFYVDTTFGRGGHARRLLSLLNADGKLLVFDRDADAVACAQTLAINDSRLWIRHAPFSRLHEAGRELNILRQCDGILMDLGVSSPQLDEPQRGFGFMQNGPLDMRMDATHGESAAEWLNKSSEKEIFRILKIYGEERQARRIATAIVRKRSVAALRTTRELADLVTETIGRPPMGKHPATRTFQAIRIQVNDELGELQEGLSQAIHLLRPGGRLVVICFHSLEDRIVKRFFREQSRGEILPRKLPVRGDSVAGRTLHLIGRPIRPGESEVEDNPRARSATLRVAERLL